MIEWSLVGEERSRSGLTCGDMKLTHPSSGSVTLIDIDEGSNVGEDGKYVYCLTDLTQPIRECIVELLFISIMYD